MSEDRALSGVARRPEPRLLVYGGLVAALALGAGLRLYLLSDQPLLDDEWHAVAFARKLSFFGSLIRINIGANSPAVNFYAWLVLHTVGYSEWVLRLPFLAAGLLGLVVMPLSVRSVVTGRAAVVFGFLLAISPSLIYYSRLFRAYGAYVVLGFLAITCLYLWAVRGGRKWAGGFVILGSVAVYFHLLAAVAIIVPLSVVWLAKLVGAPGGRLRLQQGVVLGWPSLLGGTFAAGLCVLMAALPVLRSSFLSHVLGIPDQATIETLLAAASLASGTANPGLATGFWFLALLGLVLLWRRDKLLALMILALAMSYATILSLIKVTDIHLAVVLLRYCLVLLPIICLLVAIAVDWILTSFGRRFDVEAPAATTLLNTVGVGALLSGLILTGPLPYIYRYPNNFTNHFAFQQSYATPDWEAARPSYAYSPVLSAGTISPFYRTLGAISEDFSIIEYPMFMGNHSNLHYYTQQFHKKRTLIGYAEGQNPGWQNAGDTMFPDELIGWMPNTEWMKLKNMIYMADVSALRRSGARYAILHWDLLREGFGRDQDRGLHPRPSEAVTRLLPLYGEAFGRPVFEDQDLVVFEISP